VYPDPPVNNVTELSDPPEITPEAVAPVPPPPLIPMVAAPFV
jgi:hypothetical protein